MFEKEAGEVMVEADINNGVFRSELYARIGRKYLKLQMTAAEVDKIVQENEQLKSKIRSNLRWAEQNGNEQMYMKLNSILNELKEMY